VTNVELKKFKDVVNKRFEDLDKTLEDYMNWIPQQRLTPNLSTKQRSQSQGNPRLHVPLCLIRN
jgi:hypothetical protein